MTIRIASKQKEEKEGARKNMEKKETSKNAMRKERKPDEEIVIAEVFLSLLVFFFCIDFRGFLYKIGWFQKEEEGRNQHIKKNKKKKIKLLLMNSTKIRSTKIFKAPFKIHIDHFLFDHFYTIFIK